MAGIAPFVQGQHFRALTIQGLTPATVPTSGLAVFTTGTTYDLYAYIQRLRHGTTVQSRHIAPVWSTVENQLPNLFGNSVSISCLRIAGESGGNPLLNFINTFLYCVVSWTQDKPLGGTHGEQYVGYFLRGNMDDNGVLDTGEQVMTLELRPIDPGTAAMVRTVL